MKRNLILLGLLIATGASAQEVNKYIPGSMEDGVIYYLPKTEIRVEVIAEKITYTPGELCQYANRYLKLDNISDKPEVHWEIKSVKAISVGIPDPNNAYGIKLKDKSVASQVELTDDGIIKAINTTYPLVTESTSRTILKPTQAVNPKIYMTEDMLNATSSAKMAELVSREIYNIRDSKNSLTRGQADYMPKDGEALKIMLQNLDIQELSLTSMFSGVTTKEEKCFTFNITPESNMKDKVLFRISNKLGIVNAENLAGAPVYKTINNEDKKEKKKKIEGVIYNIPGKAMVTVGTSVRKYFEGELPVTQFGTTEVLTDNLFNKKINTKVIFNPSTGGIIKIDKNN